MLLLTHAAGWIFLQFGVWSTGEMFNALFDVVFFVK